jgi:predicted metallo-beta-lactamase superfamily hydrolase
MYVYIYILDILVDKTVPLKPIRDRSPPQARPVARETSARAGASCKGAI